VTEWYSRKWWKLEELQQKQRANRRSTVQQGSSSASQALFLLLIWFWAGPADSGDSGPVDTVPVGADLVAIADSDTGQTGTGLRTLDSFDAGPCPWSPPCFNSCWLDWHWPDIDPADPGQAETGPSDTGPAETGQSDTDPADTDVCRRCLLCCCCCHSATAFVAANAHTDVTPHNHSHRRGHYSQPNLFT
jgi:hypothetical protein